MRKRVLNDPANEWSFFAYERVVINSASRLLDLTVGDRRIGWPVA